MNTTKAHRLITVSAVGVLIIGVANSVFKHKELPAMRFFIGVGVVYLSLSALAEAEPEIANAFAIAILTGTFLSSDSEKGWLSYFQSNKEEMAAPGKGSLGVNVPRREPEAGVGVTGELEVGHRLPPPALTSTLSALPPVSGLLPSAFDRRRETAKHNGGCNCG